MTRELKFGQTPWDNLSDDRKRALIRELRDVLSSAVPAMEMQRLDERYWGFWVSWDGSGANAYARTVRALELTRDEPQGSAGLLRGVIALYCAAGHASSAIRICSITDGEPPETELKALASVLEAAVKKARGRRSDEEIYRNFTRYADVLVFAGTPRMRTFNWCVCRACNAVTAGDNVVPDGPCNNLLSSPCAGTYRKYAWADLKRPELDD